MTVAVNDLGGGPTPGSAVNPNALYALPVFSLFPYVLSGVALGNAQACLDDYVELARHRASTYNRAKIGDLQSTQIKIAEASAKIDAARLHHAFDLHRGDGRRQAGRMSRIFPPRPGCGVTAPFRSICARKPCRCCLQPAVPAVYPRRRIAAPVSRCPCDQFPSGVQFRCGRHQLRACCAWSAIRKPDALRQRRMNDTPKHRPIRIQPGNSPATVRRSIPGIFATRSAPSPPASPSSRRLRPTASPTG